MKNSLKLIIAFMLGLLVSGTLVYAISLDSSEISYNNTRLDLVLDDLYTRAGQSLNITTSTLISNNNSAAATSISFVPSNDYKYYILTNLYFSGSVNSTAWMEYIDIDTITNASYIRIGATGRDAAASSGASRSFLIIPDGSGEEITVTYVNRADSTSIYGIN